MPPKTFWALVLERREALGLSRAELADRAGISEFTIRNGELGQRPNPSRETMCRIAVVLQFTPAALGLAVCPALASAA